MWESNMFKRLIPAFAILIFGVAMYIATKYTVSSWFEYGYCATTGDSPYLNPNAWGIATWIFKGFGLIVMISFILSAWMIVTGRKSVGGGEVRKPRKPKQTGIQMPWQQ